MQTASSHEPAAALPIDAPPAACHAAQWADVSDRTIVTQMPHIRQELTLVNRAIARCGTAGMPAGYSTAGFAAMRRTNDIMASALQSQDRELALLESHRENLIRWTERFEQVILSLPQWRDRLILRSCYGEGLRDTEIGDMMRLTRHYVNRLRHQAVMQLSDLSPSDRIP